MVLFFIVSLSIFTNMGLGNVLSENIPVSDYAILFVITAISFYFTPWFGRILITVLFLSALFYCSAGFSMEFHLWGLSLLFMKRILMKP